MHTFRVQYPDAGWRGTDLYTYLRGLMDALVRGKEQTVRVYSTWVRVDDREYTFITTSKDLHLRMGALDKKGQQYLALLLHHEHTEHRCSSLILYMEDEDKGAMLVTIQPQNATSWQFHIAPAN